jgi:hypothetical protein
MELSSSGPEDDVGQALLYIQNFTFRSFLESLTESKKLELDIVETDLAKYAGLGQEFKDIAQEYSIMAFKKEKN